MKPTYLPAGRAGADGTDYTDSHYGKINVTLRYLKYGATRGSKSNSLYKRGKSIDKKQTPIKKNKLMNKIKAPIDLYIGATTAIG
ncbi:MAG: hypothetical protein ACYC49_00370 [Ignavibacteriaceae bacterium]